MEGASVPEDLADPAVSPEKTPLRQVAAYILMFLFVVLTSVGAFLIFPAAGFIVAGINCGMYGYLLGAE